MDAPDDPPARPRLRLVGPPELQVAGRDLPYRLERIEAALFALLAMDGASPRRRLVAELWPETRSSAPAANLRQLRKKLRSALGREFMHGEDTLALDDDVAHDLAALSGAEPDPQALPAGELLGSFDYSDRPSLHARIEAARALWRTACERVHSGHRSRLDDEVQRLLQAGRIDAALVLAERMLLEEPTVEQAYLRVARLHRARGDRAGALALIERCRAMLWREFRVEPGQAMCELATLVEHLGAQRPAAAALPPALLHPPQLAGRAAELEQLAAAWRSCRPVLLLGEPGIGKSRLLAAFARDRPAALSLAAAIGDAVESYGLLTRVLRALTIYRLDRCPARIVGELARLLPELGAESELPPYTPRLAEAVREAILHARREGLEGLLIDDLQCSDEASLELLLQSLHRLGRDGPRWVLACRHGEQPAALTGWQVADPLVLSLAPLDEPGLRELFASLGLPGMNPVAWAAAMGRRALGNPMHVLETLIALWQRGGEAALLRAMPDARAWPVPLVLQQLVQGRLLALGDKARRLAQLAALAETEFSVALAARVLGCHELELSDAWAELESRGVLRESAFVHDLLREAMRPTVPPAIARELHRQIAQAAEASGASAARVAHHWRAADDPSRAAQHYELAAVAASRLNLRARELALWDLAAGCHDDEGQGDAAWRARSLAFEAALLISTQGETQARAEALQQAARSDTQRLAGLLALARVALTRIDPAQALHWAAQARDLAARLGAAGTLRLRGVLASSAALTQSARAAEALAELEEVRGDVLRGGDLRDRLDFLGTEAFALAYAGRHAASALAYRESLALAEQLDDWAEAMTMAANLAGVVSRGGDYPQACMLSAKALEWKRRLGAERSIASASAQMNHGMFSARLGRYAEGLASLRAALEVFAEGGSTTWTIGCENQIAYVWLELGQPEAARAAMRSEGAANAPGMMMRRLFELMIVQPDPARRLAPLRALQAASGREPPATAVMLDLAMLPALPDGEVLALGRRVEQAFVASGSEAIAQHARIRQAEALLRLGRTDAAVALIDAVLDGVEHRRPYAMYFGEVWWSAHRVFAGAGRAGPARDALQRGMAWLHEVALTHLPSGPSLPGGADDTARAAFLQGNAVNRLLLAAGGV